MNYNEIHYIKSPLCLSSSHQERILRSIEFLRSEIERIDIYLDRSLFFQNNEIIQSWIELVNDLKEFDPTCFTELDKDWDERTETNAGRLLPLRKIYIRYQELYQLYYKKFYNLLDSYPNWGFNVCYTGKGMKILSDDLYKNDFAGETDVKNYLSDLNQRSTKVRLDIFSVLKEIHKVYMIIMNKGDILVSELNPADIDFAKAIDNDLRELTRNYREDILKEMKEDLNRHYKDYRTAPYTPELWSQMLDADENALKLAKIQQLSESNDPKHEHWGDDMKKNMDDNSKLMSLIYSSCHTEEIFNFAKYDKVKPFIPLLKSENLSMFYEIVVRINLIQCEMFPDLKLRHEAWLKGVGEKLIEEVKGTDLAPLLPDDLQTEQAMIYWERLKQNKFVDDHYHLLKSTTRQQSALIAEIFAEKLGIKTKWKTFEDFWGINNLAQEKNQRTELGKPISRSNEIEEVFKE